MAQFKGSVLNPWASGNGGIIDHGTSDTSGYTLAAGRIHKWGEVSSLDISSLADTSAAYHIVFSCPSGAATTLTLPSGLDWDDDKGQPTLAAGKTYEISILGLRAVYIVY